MLVFAVTVAFLGTVLVFTAGVAAQLRRDHRRARTQRAVRAHLALLTRRGLPLGPGLLALAREHGAERPKLRRETDWIQSFARSLDEQGSLVRTLEATPGLYTTTELAVLRAAEEKGALPQALAILLEEESSGRERRSQLITLLSYPLVTTGSVLGILLFTDVFIIPKFKAIFESMNVELPALTEALLGLGDFLDDFGLVFAATVAALLALGYTAHRYGFDTRRPARRWAQAVAARMPWLGRTVRQRIHGRWLARTAALLDAGATLPEALAVAGADAPRASARALASAAERASEGEPVEKVLAVAFGRDARELVPAVLLSAAAGLPAACRETARRLTERSSRRVDALLKAVEWVPMLPSAVLVAAHFWGVLLPIVKLQGAMIP